MLSLLWGKGDFRETIRIGLACGYDTDCICASAASVLGIIMGANKLLNEDKTSDTGLSISVNIRRKDGSIFDFARDVCAAGITAGQSFSQTEITAYPTDTNKLRSFMAKPIPTSSLKEPFSVHIDYDANPIIGIKKDCKFILSINSHLNCNEDIVLTLTPPKGLCVSPSQIKFHISPDSTAKIDCRTWVSDNIEMLSQKNIFKVSIESTSVKFEDTFGIVGCEIWYGYGPFLSNNRDISHIPPSEKYDIYLTPAADETSVDVVREYHLGGIADIDRAFIDESEPFLSIKSDGRAECIAQIVQIGEDLFDTAKIQPYEGSHVGYLLRKLWSPSERKVELAVGHTAPFKLWINGKLIGTDKKTKWWTVENRHFYITLNEGENIIILKYAQLSDHAKYSLIYRIDGGDWRQFGDMGSCIK